MDQETVLEQVKFVAQKFSEMEAAMRRMAEALHASKDLIALLHEENERLMAELRARVVAEMRGLQ